MRNLLALLGIKPHSWTVRWCYLFLAGTILIFPATRCAAAPPPAVTLAWDPVTGDVAGYRLYAGTRSGTYSQVADAGNTTQLTLTNLTNGVTYYFSVTAYSSQGAESAYATEISYQVGSETNPPPTGPTLTLTQISAGVPTIQGAGMPSHVYIVQTSSDFGAWTNLGNVTADSSGHFAFSDSSAPSVPVRFYRVQDISSQ